MSLDERLQEATVLGAAGKMGSGIALLLAQEMALQKLKKENRDKTYRLNLIDLNPEALSGLVRYIRAQAVRTAEKTVVTLRGLYADRADLVENAEIVQQFVEDVAGVLWPGTDLALAAKSHLVFEAILENKDVKIDLLKKLVAMCPKDAFFFTNTSSIPIGLLDSGAGLDGRIVGYHFYNPPAVQKLVEMITGEGTREDLRAVSQELAKRLRKTIIPANDIAGFIGNGHFIRDGLYAIAEVNRLKQDFSEWEGIYLLNKVSQDLLLRPMGIFQLIDYVGVDVFQCIQRVMTAHIAGEDLTSPLIDRMVQAKVLGGQRADGSQKNGFLSYEKGRPSGVYDLAGGQYRPLDPTGWTAKLDAWLGAAPKAWRPWKQLLGDPARGDKLTAYFQELRASGTEGAKLALAYLGRSKEIGQKLVADGVAKSAEDVNGVLLNGFYHLYGPINDYVAG